ncbi:MAG: DUF6084 family protein [Solirubrobacteraceae bacterium]
MRASEPATTGGRDPISSPAPAFEVLGAEPVAHAAAPTLRYSLRVADPSGQDVHAIALAAQLQLDPARRSYDAATRERLVELFGAPERWAATTRSFLWAQVGAVVPAFRGQADFTLDVACTYDLEVAAAKYIHSLPGGEAPVTFHFSGTILYGRMQISMVPWSCSASWKLPVETWKRMMALHYPGGGWVRLEAATLDRLAERKARGGLRSFDATVSELLDE